ncbi:hypothetical protein MMC07_005990 [Pseudocyphellaria aurata]|nr:hypothetical protein [Pseudocyphellaria aurata]
MTPLITFLAYYYLTTVNSSINPSIDLEASNDWSLFADSSTVPVDSGGTKTFPLDVNIDQTAQGLPGYQGSLFVSSSINSAVSDSGSTAFDDLGTQSVSLNLPSTISRSGSIVPEDVGVPNTGSNIAPNAPETVASVPNDQELPIDNSIHRPSTLEAGMPESEDQGNLYLGSVTAPSSSEEVAVPEEQNNEISPGGIPCYSKQKRNPGRVCRPNYQFFQPKPKPQEAQPDAPPKVRGEADKGGGRTPPRTDRPENLVEPIPRDFQSKEGPEQPLLENDDRVRKRCPPEKTTLCCDGPWSLPNYVANCFDCTFFF